MITRIFLSAIVSLVGLFSIISTAALGDELSDPGGIICHATGTDAHTFEVEKKASGDLIVRISGAKLLGGRMPAVRSVEAQFVIASCEPANTTHWINGELFTCVGPVQPVLRDGNGESLSLPGNFKRLYINAYLVKGWPLALRNWYEYELRITTDSGEIIDTAYFQVDPSNRNECKLR